MAVLRAQTLAWGVHLLTASSAVWGLLALLAIAEAQWLAAFGWMLVATVVDSADGVLARRARVAQILPRIDGALLDNIVDYFTYVLVPAFFLIRAELLPPDWALAGAALLVLASAYQFSQADAKTADHYFTGFPSYWNVVVFYLFFLDLSPTAKLLLVLLLCGLVFVPIKYVYPSRTARLRRLTSGLAIVWAGLVLAILAGFPEPAPWLVWGSLLYVGYYMALSLYSTAVRPVDAG